jgi:hypothetical protein
MWPRPRPAADTDAPGDQHGPYGASAGLGSWGRDMGKVAPAAAAPAGAQEEEEEEDPGCYYQPAQDWLAQPAGPSEGSRKASATSPGQPEQDWPAQHPSLEPTYSSEVWKRNDAHELPSLERRRKVCRAPLHPAAAGRPPHCTGLARPRHRPPDGGPAAPRALIARPACAVPAQGTWLSRVLGALRPSALAAAAREALVDACNHGVPGLACEQLADLLENARSSHALGGPPGAAGGWRLAAGGWRLAAGGWRLAAAGHCWCNPSCRGSAK